MSNSSEEKPEQLPEGNLAGAVPRLLTQPPMLQAMPQAEARFRQWAMTNGIRVKCVHVHHLPEFDTFFAIFEAAKDS